jgi:hypothetical protein
VNRAPQTTDEMAGYVTESLRLLIESPGWDTFMEILATEVRAGRRVLLRGVTTGSIEESALQDERARGGIKALEELVHVVYRNAGVDASADIRRLFD